MTPSFKTRPTLTSPLTRLDMANFNQTLFWQSLTNHTLALGDVEIKNWPAMLQGLAHNRIRYVRRQMIFAWVFSAFSSMSRWVSCFIKSQVTNVFVPAVGDRDSDDLRQNSSALFPPEFYVDYLHTAAIQKKIGAETKYQECPDAPFNLFVTTGDVSE